MSRDILNAELVRQREAELRRSAERHVAAPKADVTRRAAPSVSAIARLSLALIARRARNPDLVYRRR
jgi:hypothetical protein